MSGAIDDRDLQNKDLQNSAEVTCGANKDSRINLQYST